MSKTIKIIFSILFLISISVSILLYFDLFSFAKIKNIFYKENKREVSKSDFQQELDMDQEKNSQFIIEQKEKSSCFILPEEYCSQGKLIYIGGELVGLGFKVPEGTEIYAPFNGELEVDVLQEINSEHYPSLTLIDMSNEDYASCDFKSLFTPLGYLYQSQKNDNKFYEKNQFLANVGSLTVNNDWGNYNLVLVFRLFDIKEAKWSINLDLLDGFFDYVEE